ncbi:MAG: YeeE/YedE family protein [Candidatus Competibacteraceae bacterium]|nr:YeeE/YedE family protein [Candidatus Competibacteraceae bacterium]
MHKTHFCTMGAVSDWVNMGSTQRLRAWLLAIAIALLGVTIIEGLGMADLTESHPPYRSVHLAWLAHLFGGLLFGVGMTLASGCISRNLVRLGEGSGKALCVVIVIGLCVYGLNNTPLTIIVQWLHSLAIDLNHYGFTGQDLGGLFAAGLDADPKTYRLVLGAVLGTGVLILILRSREFRHYSDAMLSGVVIGVGVVGGWYLTGGPWEQEWLAQAQGLNGQNAGVQSYSFVNPLSELLIYVRHPNNPILLTFGVAAVAGVIVGALLNAAFQRRLRWEWFSSWTDFLRHLSGAILMGVGGVLAMGCTIGQGITGISMLASGSLLTLGAIILGCAATMKVQYYQMLYEDASLWDALLSSLVDLRLLPRAVRRLEAL